MATRIERYQVVEFEDYEGCADFRDALQRFLATTQGLRYMAVDPRCVLWTSGSGLSRGENRLYLSAGAVAAADGARLSFRIVQEIATEELPEDRALLIGDASDWE